MQINAFESWCIHRRRAVDITPSFYVHGVRQKYRLEQVTTLNSLDYVVILV